jgi:hypothetical protein
MILEREEDLYRWNENAFIPTSGGILAHTGLANHKSSVNISKGLYRYEVAGGKGGTGSRGGNHTANANDYAGGAGAARNVIIDTIVINESTALESYIGGDGNDANPDTLEDRGGGGGGGASGMDSLLVFHHTNQIIKAIIAYGGSGGGGGGNRAGDDGNGGGGGSRYGVANVGNGKWGYGGNCDQLAKGGEFDGHGGNGGAGGYSGNNYAGQNGSEGNGSGSDCAGGYGGAKKDVEISIFTKSNEYGANETIFYTLISAGGGGEGGTAEHVGGRAGSGASGVKTTSSGYVRVYRLW